MISCTDLPLALSCVIILSINKKVTAEGWRGWVTNRIRTFCGTLGEVYSRKAISSNEYPPCENMEELRIEASANFEVQKQIYLEILSLARGSSGKIPNAMAEIHHLLRGHELNHLILIDRYLLKDFPQVLTLPGLSSLRKDFTKAVELLGKVPENERLYIRILRTKDFSAPLNRRLFSIPAIAATTIAQFMNSSFSNYYLDDSPSSIRIQNAVITYFNTLTTMAPLTVFAQKMPALKPKDELKLWEVMETEAIKLHQKSQEEEEETADDLVIPTRFTTSDP